jgi:hypothetical protein
MTGIGPATFATSVRYLETIGTVSTQLQGRKRGFEAHAPRLYERDGMDEAARTQQ